MSDILYIPIVWACLVIGLWRTFSYTGDEEELFLGFWLILGVFALFPIAIIYSANITDLFGPNDGFRPVWSAPLVFGLYAVIASFQDIRKLPKLLMKTLGVIGAVSK